MQWSRQVINSIFAIKVNTHTISTQNSSFSFQLQDLWGILCIAFAFSNSESIYFSYEQAFGLLLLGIIYLAVRILSSLSSIMHIAITVGLLLFVLIEALIGMGQLYGFYPTLYPISCINGTFQNPESFTGFLACLLPLPLSLAFRMNDASSKRYYIIPALSILCCFLVISLLPASLNPCCWFAAGVGCYIVILHHFRTFRNYKILFHRHPKRVVFFTLIFLIFLVKSSSLMYETLKSPEENRHLLWEKSLDLIHNSPGHGHGLGSFQSLINEEELYIDPQNPFSRPEIKTAADQVSFCFNEYLRITIENGYWGLLYFLLFHLTAIYNAYRQQQAGLTGCIGAFLVFAYFSNIYDILSLSIPLSIVLALCGRHSSFLQPPTNKRYTYCSIFSQ